MRVVVILSGEAHIHFDCIHHWLDNSMLSILSRETSVSKEALEKKRPLLVSDIVTRVEVGCSNDVILLTLVKKAVQQINAEFPNCAEIII